MCYITWFRFFQRAELCMLPSLNSLGSTCFSFCLFFWICDRLITPSNILSKIFSLSSLLGWKILPSSCCLFTLSCVNFSFVFLISPLNISEGGDGDDGVSISLFGLKRGLLKVYRGLVVGLSINKDFPIL